MGSSAFQEIKNTINEHLCDLSLSHEHYGMVSSPIANSM